MEAVELLAATDHLVRLLGLQVPALSELDRRHRNFLALRTEAYKVRLQLEHLGCDGDAAALSTALDLAATEASRPTRNPRDRKNVYKAAESVLAPAVTAAARAVAKASSARKEAAAESKREAEARHRNEQRSVELETRIRLLRDDLMAMEARFGVQGPDVATFVQGRLSLLEGLDGVDAAAGVKTVAQVRKSMEKERKRLRKAERAVSKTPAYVAWKAARQALAKTEALPAAAAEALRTAVDEAVVPLFTDGTTEPTPELVRASARVTETVSAAEDLAEQLATRADAARTALNELGIRLATEDKRPAFDLLTKAESLRGLPHVDAEAVFDDLEAELARLNTLASKGPEDWEATKPRRQAFRDGCREIVVAGLFVEDSGDALVAELDGLEEALVNGVLSYTLAEVALVGLEDRLATSIRAKDTFLALEAERTAAVEVVDVAAASLAASLVALEARVGSPVGSLREREREVLSTWRAIVSTGSTSHTLDAAPTVAALQAIAAEAADVDDDGVVALGHQAACDALVERIEQHRVVALDLAEEAEIGERDVTSHRAESTELMDRVARSVALEVSERVAVLERIEVEASELSERLKSEAGQGRFLVERWQEMAAGKAREVEQVLVRIEAVVADRSLFASNKTSYATYAKTLRARLEPLAACTSIAMPAVLDDTMQKLVALHTDATRALEGAKGITADGNLPLLEQLRAELRKLAASVAGSSLLETWAPSEHARIGKELELLTNDLGGAPADEVRASMEKLRSAAGEAAAKARSCKSRAEAVRSAGADALKRLKANSAVFKGFARVYDDLESRLKAARGTALAEDMQAVAESQVLGVAQQLTQYLTVGGTLEARDGELGRLDASDADTRSVWEGRLKSFDLEFASPLDAVSTKGRSEIDKLVAAAKKTFDQGDVAAAHDQLDVAERRAVFLKAYPKGQEVATAKKLLEVEGRFRESVRSYVAALDAVTAAVERFAGEVEDDGVVAPVRSTVDELKALFGAERFTAPVRLVSDRDAALSKRAEARESALSIVRRYRERLEASESLRLLKDNPFGVSFTAHFQIGKDLLDLERCLRIAVDQSKVGGAK